MRETEKLGAGYWLYKAVRDHVIMDDYTNRQDSNDTKAEEVAQPERKKGKWIYGEDEYGIDGYHCDECGFFVPWDYAHKFINYIEDYHFCPNCGANMRGEQDG